ncbi:RecE family exodeoxyribonuclease [Citrobacter meridianamericanus]|uniref:RecE family exodeoxyribonuclease n=1 Tax=Citrobacter meridianamericanus TaxID=2894201 RepID=UPI00351CC86D
MKVKKIIQWFFGAKKPVQKQHGITGGTAWFESDDQDEADALATLAIKKAGFKRSDFFKPVRVDHLVVDDMPEEGVFDTAFCDRYKLAEDGKSWLMPAAQEEGDSTSAKVEQNGDSANSTGGQGNGPEGLGYNVNGEPMADVIKKMDWPVVEMSLPMRWMAQMSKSTKTLHLNPEEYGRVMGMTAPQDDDVAPLLNNINLMLVGDLAPELDKLDLHHLHRLVMAVEKVASTDERLGLHLLCRFVRAWLDTEYIDQGILVKEWCAGKRVSRIEKSTSTEPDTAVTVVPPGEGGAARARRSEKPTYRTLNYEIACALHDGDLDYHNLRPHMDFAKRIITEDREDWKRWSAAFCAMPCVLNYDRQSIIDCIRKAPPVVKSLEKNLKKEWVESWLLLHGVLDPDWQAQSTPVTGSHEENLQRFRDAGATVRKLEAMKDGDNKTLTDTVQPEASGNSSTVAVEPEATQDKDNAGTLEAASLNHEQIAEDVATREEIGRQLAAGRGEFVEGISDPNDPKWITEPQVIKNKETEKPEDVKKVAQGVYDASVFFSTENQLAKESGKQECKTAINNTDNYDSSPVREEIVICLLKEILVELKTFNTNQSTTAARNNRLVSAMIDEALNVVLSDDNNKKVMEHE